MVSSLSSHQQRLLVMPEDGSAAVVELIDAAPTLSEFIR
jgi:hypothetical protein